MLNQLTHILLIIFLSFGSGSFKSEQLKFSRVRQAYADKEESVLEILKENKIGRSKLNIYLRAFKKEKKIELWGKNISDEQYRLIKTYKVCRTSGSLGPKRQEGDLQIPEGYYHIDRFNPYSNFHLSLGINYPNPSDKILGVKNKLGGDIFIHGACVTIGCLPITDDQIKELYIFSVEAKNNGQKKIPVTVFPSALTDSEFKRLSEKYSAHADKIKLWTDLKKGFEIFNDSRQLPSIGFLKSGRHIVNN